jgi:hypothetical protein
MSLVVIALVVLAAMSLGLRTTGGLLSGRIHPVAHIVVAIVVGGLLSLAFLQLCDAYRIFEFGLGLLISLSPVGVFDLVRWWFRWRR